MKRDNEKRPSESFIMGVVALVFMVIGYQAALFLHRAAVLKIEANKDRPDTVFIYNSPHQICKTSSGQIFKDSQPHKAVRKPADHSQTVNAVRANLASKHVESFSFDPNTVSCEDLCRLGFTVRQAQSIINYRQKGGRYRRKSDFARSFVVSDSLYLRLEPYISIPLLDLNLADSSDFDSLPGIGGWFASKMVAHRTSLGGYSYKEQLMDIWKFDRQKYDALSDLVTVSPEHMTAYPLWTLPADSLRRHPYIGNYETARAIVLYRESVPLEQRNVAGLASAGIISMDIAAKLSRCLIQ